MVPPGLAPVCCALYQSQIYVCGRLGFRGVRACGDLLELLMRLLGLVRACGSFLLLDFPVLLDCPHLVSIPSVQGADRVGGS